MVAVADYVLGLNLCRYGLRADVTGVWRIIGHHLCYPFIHANPLHAAINGWVLIQIAWRTPIGMHHLILAFVIAWCCPAAVADFGMSTVLSGNSTVGMSGVVYALFGMLMPKVARPVRYNLVIALWLVIGALAGSTAVGVHGFCYLEGVFFEGLLKAWKGS